MKLNGNIVLAGLWISFLAAAAVGYTTARPALRLSNAVLYASVTGLIVLTTGTAIEYKINS